MKIFSIASQAIAQQTERMAKSAHEVSKAGDIKGVGKDVDLAKEAVEQISAKHLTTANVKVIKAEDERLKSLLDIIA